MSEYLSDDQVANRVESLYTLLTEEYENEGPAAVINRIARAELLAEKRERERIVSILTANVGFSEALLAEIEAA